MYTAIIIFYISLLGIVALLLLKKREFTTGHASFVSKLGFGIDHIIVAVYHKFRQGISYLNKHTFIALAQWVAFHILRHIRKVYVELKHIALQNIHTRKVIYMLRGKTDINKGGASFYLRRIGLDEVEEKKKKEKTDISSI
jgi:hypothetical protein